MKQTEETKLFDEQHAGRYDREFAAVAPLKDAMHLIMRFVLADAPANARVLCVGAGTGAELRYLAALFPDWTFTAVDPAAAMLRRCREACDKAGILARCRFHEGTLDTLEDETPYDVATSVLVSHFILERSERVAFFAEIARRLRPGGRLVSADICADTAGADFDGLFGVWQNMHRFLGKNEAEVTAMLPMLREKVAILSQEEIAALMVEGGFSQPVPLYQAMMMRAWSARRAEGS